MQELDDNALLRAYAARGSEEAFAALVQRHINKVYSVALRHTGQAHQAEEITQTVFVLLAQKAGQLGKAVILEGWLYETARFTALTRIRGEIRRGRREEKAHMQTMANENESEVWTQIAPLLDEAMATLNETDRSAIVLRFFYDKSMKEIGAALGATENAATVRLHRALEKLRDFFAQHGVTSTPDILAGAIASHSVQAAPAALVKSITALAIAKGGATLSLVKSGAVKTLTWLKATTLAVLLTNAFLSQKIVATHFNLAGNPDGWMTRSQSSLVWLLLGCGLPLLIVGCGYVIRFLPIGNLNVPRREYWLAPERRHELFDYLFHQTLWPACCAAIFVLALLLLEIQANHRTPPHFSTALALLDGGCFIVVTVIWLIRMERHFKRVPPQGNPLTENNLQTQPGKYWFRAKTIGWGWGLPCAWQGWVVLIGFLVLVNGLIPFLLPEHLAAYIGCTVALSAILVAICFAKGEKPGGN